MVDVQSVASMKAEPFAQDVDDVFLGFGAIGALGHDGVEVAVDGRQLGIDDLAFVEALLKVLVHDVDGVLQLGDVLAYLGLLQGEQLLDADVVERVLADGVDLGGHKSIPPLPEQRERGSC